MKSWELYGKDFVDLAIIKLSTCFTFLDTRFCKKSIVL